MVSSDPHNRKVVVVGAGFGGLSIAHVYFLVGMRNRMVVAIQWLWSYFTFQSGSRLITNPNN